MTIVNKDQNQDKEILAQILKIWHKQNVYNFIKLVKAKMKEIE
jgi:hypothetical protein